MALTTLRTPKGKLAHLALSDPAPITSTTFSAVVYCGKEMTGVIEDVESVESVTCARCATIYTKQQPEFVEQIEPEPDTPVVLTTPETIREPRHKNMSPGRRRHGMIRAQRCDRKRRMKEALAR